MSTRPEAEAPASATEPQVLSTNPVASSDHKHTENLERVASPGNDDDDLDKIAITSPGVGKAAAGGQAVINQREAIPTTGKRIPTGRWEYISFCIFCKANKPVL